MEAGQTAGKREPMADRTPPTSEQRRAATALSGALETLEGYPPNSVTATHDGVLVHLRPEHAAHLAVRIYQDVSQGKLA